MQSTQIRVAVGGVLLASAVLLPAAQDAEASGFAIREQSGTALGNAFAGAPTGIDDVSYIYFNPAMAGFLKEDHTAALSASYIIPNSNFKNGQASTTAAVGGVTINENSLFDDDDGDIGRNALIPATATMVSLTDELKFGLSITAPFGLLTDNTEGWEGRYHALKSELKTFDINPSLAYRVTDYLSVAGGFRAVYAEAELSQAIDFGTIGAGVGGTPTQNDGRAKLSGDDWGFGGNFGVMLDAGKLSPQLDGLRAGLAYRSRVELNIDGDTDFQKDSAGIAATLQGATGAFRDTGATAHLDLPESVSFGLHYDLNQEWAVMGQAEWTNWSEFKTLRVEFDNDNQPDSVTEEEWKDSWFFAAGTTWRPMAVEGLTLRLGVAYDQSPVPESTRTPRIPGEDRYWIAAGVGYAPASWLDISLGYTHIFIPNADIDLKATDTGNAARGNLEGEYEANIDIIALQTTIRF